MSRFTPARVALGRAGTGLPTAAHLAFAVAHAAARDAVHAPLDVAALEVALGGSCVVASSRAAGRLEYLLRPDLGRVLEVADRERLAGLGPVGGLVAVVCDGLSALAVQRQAPPLVAALGGLLAAPVVIVRQGRVAIGDDVGAALRAEAVLVLIGERPGLSAADSLGAYLTWDPRPGRTDAQRNCVSNIRPEGLGIAAAAAKIAWLVAAMRRGRLTGVRLKDEQPALAGPDAARLSAP